MQESLHGARWADIMRLVKALAVDSHLRAQLNRLPPENQNLGEKNEILESDLHRSNSCPGSQCSSIRW
jgi:hypothetical protein